MSNISEDIKGLKLKGFENIDLEKVLFWVSENEKYSKKKQALSSLFFKVLLKPFVCTIPDYSFFCEDKSQILFFKSSLIRKSYDDLFLKVASVVSSKDVLISPYNAESRRQFYLYRGLLLWKNYVFSWYSSMSDTRMSMYSKLICIYYLIRLKYNSEIFLKSIRGKKYKLLVTFYDALLEESYLVEYFKGMGVKTATLQHGQFTADRHVPFNLFYSGVEFKGSNSDYFLCWNKFTIEEAIKSGIPKSKLVLAGIPNFIGLKQKWENPGNNCFGVVLSHPSFKNENDLLIKAANLLADKYGLSFWIKFHPNFIGNEYDNLILRSKYQGQVERNLGILDYSKMVEFSIVGSSTVLTELVFLNHPIYRLSNNGSEDKYRGVNKGYVFENPEELLKVFLGNSSTSSIDLFDYLCSVKDIENNYKKFFLNYLFE